MSTNTGETGEEAQHGSLRQALALLFQRAANIVVRTDVLIAFRTSPYQSLSASAFFFLRELFSFFFLRDDVATSSSESTESE